MAIVMETNYSKKLGLPGYSSHQYSVTVRTELADLSAVEAESKRLYGLLQTAVDREIQQTGYLPPGHDGPNGNGSAPSGEPDWNCSDKQRDLILQIVSEHRLGITASAGYRQQLLQAGYEQGAEEVAYLAGLPGSCQEARDAVGALERQLLTRATLMVRHGQLDPTTLVRHATAMVARRKVEPAQESQQVAGITSLGDWMLGELDRMTSAGN